MTNIIDLSGNSIGGSKPTEAKTPEIVLHNYEATMKDGSVQSATGCMAVTGSFVCIAEGASGDIKWVAPWEAISYVKEV